VSREREDNRDHRALLATSHNVDAEASVLGAVMLRSDVLDDLALTEWDFFHLPHHALFAAMRTLRARKQPVDAITVSDELQRTGHLAAVGGLSALSEMVRRTPTADNVEHYARIVADHALRRRVAIAVAEVEAAAAKDDQPGEQLLGALLTTLGAVELPRRDESLTMREAAKKCFLELGQAIDAKRRGEIVSLKLRTGIGSLDALLRGGLPVGNVTILAGRPSQGKSALARSIADQVNAAGDGVHVFSTEDTTKAYVMRALADHGDVDLAKLWDLDVNELEWRRVSVAADTLFQRDRWVIDEARGLTIAELQLRVRRKRRANRTKLVVIDYAQIIRAPGERQHERIAAVSQGAADLAREEGCAVLLLSQLNRENEKREGNRPTLADLRGAGELEQDADVVLMVHRPEYYLRKQDLDDPKVAKQLELWAGLGLVICEKNKNGPTGQVSLGWDAKSATYRDRGRKPQENAA
jgi:replicative DNA helicase